MMRLLLILCASAIASAASAAQPIGRLFYTPDERAQLDVARTQKQRAPLVAATAPATPPPAPQIITYSGMVRRSDGKSILWLNNRPAEEKEALSALALTGRVAPDGAVTLQVPQTGSSVNLKVGQRAELQTGNVSESRTGSLAQGKSDVAPGQPGKDTAEKRSDRTESDDVKTPPDRRSADGAGEQRQLGRSATK